MGSTLYPSRAFELRFSSFEQDLLRKLEGDAAALTCSIEDKDAAAQEISIAWYQNDKPIEKDRIFTFNSVGIAELMFAAPTVNDTGDYKCMAKIGDEVQQTKTIRIEFISRFSKP
ncbi:unnamed protein product [Enterobius vermicularis]|uniref:Ig-like domain-containing protein n=1 Tax=Enterobius vermicularis TaxID=51028 RepID=A0A0N4VMQ4_ENTVE|nr:unnamed protein product [Enterobius vermicularis]